MVAMPTMPKFFRIVLSPPVIAILICRLRAQDIPSGREPSHGRQFYGAPEDVGRSAEPRSSIPWSSALDRTDRLNREKCDTHVRGTVRLAVFH